MHTKQIWAIFLIVVGVILAIKGFSDYFTVSIFSNDIESMHLVMDSHSGGIANDFFNINHFREFISSSKAAQLTIITMGVISTALGAAMLNGKDRHKLKYDFADIDDFLSRNEKRRL